MTTVHSNPNEPSEGLRERKKRQTNQRICEAAIHLFTQQGFAATTVDAIAARAEISKPTFFNYFNSKSAVLQELIEITDKQFVGYILEELDKKASTTKRLHNIMLRAANYINEHPDFTRLTLVEGLGAIVNQDQAQKRFGRLHDAMRKLLEAGLKQKDVRKDYSMEVMVQMVVGGFLYAILDWLTNQKSQLPKIMAETSRFLANAIAAR